MLEKETELILQLLTERTIGARGTIALNQIQSSAIPKNIRRYLHCEVVRWLSSDLRGTPGFSHIPTTTKTGTTVIRSLLQSLAPEYVFSREEFLVTLENAVHFVENYLCRPQWTLEHFVFENNERVGAGTLFTKLDYLTDYSYFLALIERTVRKQKWSEIDRDAFRALIARFDDQVVKQHTARELAMLTKPIYDFLSLEESPPDRPVPLKPILVFFDDKRMRILKEHIERTAEIRKRSDLTLLELTEIIEKLYVGAGDTATPPGIEQEAPAYPDLPKGDDLPVPPTESGTISPSVEEATVGPATQIQIVQESDASSASIGSPGSPGEETLRPINRVRANPTLSLTFAGLKETQETHQLPDLQTLIAGEQRVRFIKNVFKSNEALYTGVLAALNQKLTWKEASVYLDEQYQTSSLDPFDEAVVEFTDAIHRRYTAQATDAE